MSNKNQSSIEWLVEKIQQANPSFKFDALIRQAKEMEKQQIIDAFEEGYFDQKSAEQYYNETYGGDK
jgi:hypothetical protein